MASKNEEVEVKAKAKMDEAEGMENETEDSGTAEEPATATGTTTGSTTGSPTEQEAGDEGDDSDKKRRVYVGNLAWEVSWQDLKDLMKTLNHEVVRVDIMQTSDGRSKGCGIVEFATPEGAAEAVLTLNDTELSGRRIFVREDRENSSSGASGRDYSSRGGRHNNQRNRYQGNNQNANSYNNNSTVSSDPESQSRRVYVGNMSWDVTWSDLKDHMKTAGEVVRADVICEHNGRSKGCGIVEFETEEGAQKAIETLTHTELRGRMIFVREDREGSGSEGKGGHAPRRIGTYNSNQNHASNNSVYVWNLSYDVSWQDLKDHMRKAGNVDQATILTGRDGSTSIGCGIVVYQSARDAARAIRELQESDLKGRPVRLREDKIASAGTRSERGERGGRGGRHGGGGKSLTEEPSTEVTQLYVGNLSYDTTWKELKEHFKQAGDVLRADVKTSDSGRSKGFGIVKFARPEDAQTAISTLSGVELDGRPLEVRPDHKA
eukprot:jgi/Psemu1/282582/fgenesh1_pg.10_\